MSRPDTLFTLFIRGYFLRGYFEISGFWHCHDEEKRSQVIDLLDRIVARIQFRYMFVFEEYSDLKSKLLKKA